MAELVALLFLVAVAWLAIEMRPLADAERHRLIVKRRMLAVARHYEFHESAPTVNSEFKKTMDPRGRWYVVDEPLAEFPALAAGLLKGKKHEWVVFGLAKGLRIVVVWLNKGLDNKQVSAYVSTEELLRHARQVGASTVIEVHNHPNPDPSRYFMLLASERDRISAEAYGASLARNGLEFLTFVAERGRYRQHACWLPDAFIPAHQFASTLSPCGRWALANITLRWELRARESLLSWLDQPNATHNVVAN